MDFCLTENDIPGSSLSDRRPSELKKNDSVPFWLKCRSDCAEGL